ncbi:hypothetical protein AM1_C0138 (plasmid) [Acaryochloris marina MBIC11017]|uniref:Uncharacterized protein n=1 Tax=Acaryochloris marina (strain MBIC 11017) TaxID=329726 RepID=A8ZMN4_ACAM1|nr:hypothetical protein AM1_C0138 [Acaryochloris marina MBIC11017]
MIPSQIKVIHRPTMPRVNEWRPELICQLLKLLQFSVYSLRMKYKFL